MVEMTSTTLRGPVRLFLAVPWIVLAAVALTSALQPGGWVVTIFNEILVLYMAFRVVRGRVELGPDRLTVYDFDRRRRSYSFTQIHSLGLDSRLVGTAPCLNLHSGERVRLRPLMSWSSEGPARDIQVIRRWMNESSRPE